MTALNLADIPPEINTLERLLVWAAGALQVACNGKTVNVVDNEQQQPRCSLGKGVLANDEPNYLVSAYIPVDLAAEQDRTQGTWMAAKDLTNTSIHPNYLES